MQIQKLKKRVLIIFKDDSSLLSARRFADIFEPKGFDVFLCHSYNPKYNGMELSERQINESSEGRKIHYSLQMRDVAKESFLSQFDVVASCKFPTIFQLKFMLGSWCFTGKRPCFVATFPGIDFTPKLGIRARQFVDIMCINGPADRIAHSRYVPGDIQKRQKVLQFSPFFYIWRSLKKVTVPKCVVFFSQSIMPKSKESRSEILAAIMESARRNPSIKFIFKLRHLENENTQHTHVEDYSYEILAKEIFERELPDNFQFTVEYIGNLLEKADLAITCASTAGVEALGCGVPSLFVTNYSGANREKHSRKLQNFIRNSGLETDISGILNLNMPNLNQEWLDRNMSTEAMLDSVIVAIDDFDPYCKVLGTKVLKYCPRILSRAASAFL